ncbi:MAG: ATP-binding cassette domain-containing protein [Pelosinus sp.]|nr:ATP-binding cassette domain-containing protein [Pelosinus sp.]
MLELHEVTKRFPKNAFILGSINCHLSTGLHVLAGPNGSGKSTLLRIAAGILPPDRGNLLFGGQDIYANLAHYKKNLGYVPQTFAFYSHMTGMDFLLYLANLKGIFSKAAKKQASYVADLLGILEHCPRKISTWSIGLRQRLAIAQALLNDPDILILDEPLCGLAFEETTEIQRLLYTWSHNKVILMSSHHIDSLPIAKLLLLCKGTLQFAGLPSIFSDQAAMQVWTAKTSKSTWQNLHLAFPLSTAVFTEDGCHCRIISNTKPDLPNIKPALPTLEEAYLVWLERLKRNEAEQQHDHRM